MITDFTLQPLQDPHYIKAALATYTQDGIAKDWEVVEAHDSVAILIYHREDDAFVLVRQFRPAVYLNNGNGETVELCAGLVDKETSLEQIAREEIYEECGYDVPLEAIERITSFHTSVGFAGSRQTLYYVEVDETMHTGQGGGIDQEQIEIVKLPVAEAEAFIYKESIAKTPGLMFAFLWWQKRNSSA
jgi:UDP-sugar diphosphatase